MSRATSAIIAVSLLGCPLTSPADPPPRTDETTRMVERLEASATMSLDPANIYANEERSTAMRDAFDRLAEQQGERLTRFRLGLDLLRAGQTTEAIAQFELVLDQTMRSQRPMPRNITTALGYLALANLRWGEQANCILQHAPESCLLPISGDGVHVDKRGSTRALQLYTSLLERTPDDPSAIWLLNIAAMTLGEHPAAVPERWRVDMSVLGPTSGFPRFPEVAMHLGVATRGLAGGCVMEDLDGDGDLDLLVSSWGARDPLRLHRNDGDGGFTDVTSAAGLDGISGGLNLVHADYDNDGDADVLVLRGAWMQIHGRQPNSLLRNRGDGTFDDVTESAGILSARPTQTAAWADLDGDGWLDLFIGNESSEGQREPCELFRSNGDGTFTEMAAAAGIDHVAYVKAVVAGDVDNDGRPDLFLSCGGAENALYMNRTVPGGSPRFENAATTAGVVEPIESFPAWFFDYDNDGDEDLFVAGYGTNNVGDVLAGYLGQPTDAARPRLYRNRGDGTFDDVTAPAGLDIVTMPMGCNFGDLDSDGNLDFYLGTGEPTLESLMPNRMFRGDGRGAFTDVTVAGGFGHVQKGHGVAFGDLDRDGDQDVACVMGGAFSGDVAFNTVFANPGHGNHWIS
ncbi:MAG: FG-GAP-like repeat-containing protein, partial [Planctomycetota bacterium]